MTLAGWLLASCASACGSPPAAPLLTGPSPGAAETAPTYTELFTKYFAPGTAGHCATSGCHADPGHNVWRCATKEDCYEGMVDIGLIDPAHPTGSPIADPSRSPITWLNAAGGNMPLDAQNANPQARDAIIAWVAAGAHDD